MIQKRPQILKKQKQKMPKQMKKQKAKDKDDAEKEIPKYNIQLTFEDGTTAEIHTSHLAIQRKQNLSWKVK